MKYLALSVGEQIQNGTEKNHSVIMQVSFTDGCWEAQGRGGSIHAGTYITGRYSFTRGKSSSADIGINVASVVSVGLKGLQ